MSYPLKKLSKRFNKAKLIRRKEKREWRKFFAKKSEPTIPMKQFEIDFYGNSNLEILELKLGKK